MNHQPSESDIRSVMKHYGYHVQSTSSCSSVYKKVAAYKAVTDGGTFLVKPFAGTEGELSRIAANMRLLKRQRFEQMPAWLKTKHGERYVRYKDRLFYATEWIEGNMLGGLADHADYQALGQTLAELHGIVKKDRRKSFHIDKLIRQHRLFASKQSKLSRDGSDMGRWFREHGAACVRLGNEANQTLQINGINRQLRKAGSVIIHGDVTRPNVIVNDSRLYLIDWENVQYGSAYLELVKAITNTSFFALGPIQKVLEGYNAQNRLSSIEKKIVAALFRYPREAWHVGLRTGRSKKNSTFESLKISWNSRLHAIKWLDDWAKG
jgi:Ser/Thr protein kinase RdoA (MazF antagonist)